jgi:AcrR family transcriptional regulator
VKKGKDVDMLPRIREAALVEFDEKGIRFTMDDLSRRLGVSKKTLYAQVRVKDDVIAMLIEDAFASIKEQERRIVGDDSLDLVEKIKRVLTIMPSFAGALDYRRVFEIRRYYPQLFQRIERHLETDWEVTLKLLEEAIGRGRVRRVNLDIVRETLASTMECLLRDEFLLKSGLSYETVIREVVDMLFEGLLTKGGAR